MCDICLNSDSDEYNDFIKDIENNFNFDSIGKSYDTKTVDSSYFYMMSSSDYKMKVINLYKYEPQPGYSPIKKNTRRFCSRLYLRTIQESNYLTFEEVQSLSNPGSKYGVNDILFYAGNYTTNRAYTTCRHRWIRYKYDTVTKNIVKDVTQPGFVSSTAKR